MDAKRKREKEETALRDRTKSARGVLWEYQMEKWLFYEHNGRVGIRRARHTM